MASGEKNNVAPTKKNDGWIMVRKIARKSLTKHEHAHIEHLTNIWKISPHVSQHGEKGNRSGGTGGTPERTDGPTVWEVDAST